MPQTGRAAGRHRFVIVDQAAQDMTLPAYVEQESEEYLNCGRLDTIPLLQCRLMRFVPISLPAGPGRVKMMSEACRTPIRERQRTPMLVMATM